MSRVASLILAAGKSQRMGYPKALLDFQGKTVLEILLEKCFFLTAGAVTVVLGFAEAEIRRRVPFLECSSVVSHPRYAQGQTSSLKAGLLTLGSSVEAFLLFPIDVPLVKMATIQQIIQVWERSRKVAVVPMYGGKKGHPTLFDRALFSELLDLGDEEPIHTVLRRDPGRVEPIEVADPAVVFRMNTPEEYQRALDLTQRGTL